MSQLIKLMMMLYLKPFDYSFSQAYTKGNKNYHSDNGVIESEIIDINADGNTDDIYSRRGS